MEKLILGTILCGIAGGLASYFGGLGAIVAVVLGEIGILYGCL